MTPANRRASRAGAAVAAAALLAVSVPGAAQADPGGDLSPSAIDGYVSDYLDASGAPGLSVVVTHDDQIVRAAGYGHDSTGAAMTAQTPMRIASLSKSFTAMAIMMLVEDGKVELDVPLARQLDGFDMADPRAGEVTVRQLLTQTSGFSDTSIDTEELEDADSPAQYVEWMSDDALASDPGTQWEYCNANFNVLGRLVEVAGGEPFGDFMRHHVFEPLDMTGTALSDEDIRPPNGYNSLFGQWISRPEMPGFLDDSGGGGVITNAQDMGRWLISQNGQGTQLVSQDSLHQMHTPTKIHDYGMGWGVLTGGGDDPTRLEHSGNLFTYNAVEAVVPDTGYGFAVMTNGSGVYDDSYAVMEGLLALSQGRTPAEPGGYRVTIEWALGAVLLLVVGLSVLGVARSRRWASRRAGTAWWRIGVRLLPAVLMVAGAAAFPDVLSWLAQGRTITWEQMTYFGAPLTIDVVAAGIGAAVVIGFRLWRLRTVTAGGGRGHADPATDSNGQPTAGTGTSADAQAEPDPDAGTDPSRSGADGQATAGRNG
jgi:CubicO group peptidase (beta-lactamase class C family)